jgi:hypothetical protein
MQEITQGSAMGDQSSARREQDSTLGEQDSALQRQGSAMGEQASFLGETEPAPTAAEEKEKPYPWIIHPVVDMLFCCGIFPLLIYGVFLMGFRMNVIEPVGFTIWALWIIGVHAFQDAHGIATWHRIFTHPETMASIKIYFIVITVIAALLFLPLLLNQAWLIIALRFYLLFGLYHWLMQSYGVTLIYFFKRGYILNGWERRLVLMLFQGLLPYTFLRFFTVPDYGSWYFQGFTLPFAGPLPAWMMNAAEVFYEIAVVAFAIMVVRKYIAQKILIPLPALVLIATTIWIFTLGGPDYLLLAFFIGAFYHGSQSWCVTTSFHWKAKGLPQGVSNNTIWKVFWNKSTWKYLALLFIISELIYSVAPRVLAQFGVSVGIAFATMSVIFSGHHFLCDAAVWKLKNPKLRAMLIR